MNVQDRTTRRGFLISTGTLAAGFGLPRDAFGQELAPTPACHDGDEPTVKQTEGPFFKPRSPQRADLREPGTSGQPLELTGYVLTRRCQPVAGALVDLWHADDRGEYDNKGFRYRGHQFTDGSGTFRFLTIQPAVYTGRTRHYHVKVQPRGGRVLTTQPYFSDEPRKARDGLFRRELLMRVAQAAPPRAAALSMPALAARFDFVLDVR